MATAVRKLSSSLVVNISDQYGKTVGYLNTKYTPRQWSVLIIFGVTNLLSTITISLQAPFYPAEAERKGASATEYGIVFGVFEFVVFLGSPIVGQYMNKLGPKQIFSGGILVTSVAVVCFGLTAKINDHTWFIVIGFICRLVEAIGFTCYVTATFTITACEFPTAIATTFAALETFAGIGFIVGPTVGGALYDVGGFPLPFFAVGGALLVCGIACFIVMPKMDTVTDASGNEQEGYSVWVILKFPLILLAAVSQAMTSASMGFISATLEPHIRQFGLTPVETGLVFIVSGGLYAVSAPIVGYIADRIKHPIYFSILGNFLNFCGFLLIGPASFMPFDTILWVTIVGLVFQGFACGFCLVSNFTVCLKESMRNGLPDNMATYGVASGLWTSMLSLGAFIGPTVAGVLYDQVGFRHGTWLIIVGTFVVGTTMLVFTCGSKPSTNDSSEESEPIIGKPHHDPSSLPYGATC